MAVLPQKSVSAVASAEAQRAAKLREQITSILDKLDSVDDSKHRNRRNGSRTSFRRHEVAMHISHPGGSKIVRAVATRNLCASGIGVIYPSFLHTGTQVEVVLQRRLGGEDRLRGRVVFCAHVAGTFHQVGVRFDQKIFPKLYLDGGSEGDPHACGSKSGAASAWSALNGTLLLIDDQQIERTLMEHHLHQSGVQLTAVSDEKQALKLLASMSFDMVLCDLNLETSTGETTITAIREAGFAGPICIVTAERAPARLEAAMKAGAIDVLQKPYDQPRLFALLGSHLNRRESAAGETIVSSLPITPTSAKPLENYVKSVRALADEIRIAAQKGELERLRQMCDSLRASGTNYGFPRLFEAAQDAIRVLDASRSVERSLKEVTELADLCRRVSVAK